MTDIFKRNFKKNLIIVSSLYGFFIIGITFSILSPILIEVSLSLKEKLVTVATIFTFLFIGYAIGPFISNISSRIIPRKVAIGLIFFIQALFLFIFSFSKNIYFANFIFFIIGLCGGFNDANLSVLLVEMKPGREGFFINFSHIFLALGAFVGPYISSLVINNGFKWQTAFFIASSVAIINFLLFIFLKVPNNTLYKRKREKVNNQKTDEISKLNKKNIYLLLVSLLAASSLFYTFTESGLNTWIPSFLRLVKSFSQINSSQVLSFFWLAIAIGRLIISFISIKFNLFRITIIISMGSAFFIILGIFINSNIICALSLVLVGLFLSGIFPNIIAIASISYKKNQGSAVSLIIACGGIGALLSPQIVGFIYKTFSFNIGFIVLSLVLLTLGIFIFIFMKIINKRSNIN